MKLASIVFQQISRCKQDFLYRQQSIQCKKTKMFHFCFPGRRSPALPQHLLYSHPHPPPPPPPANGYQQDPYLQHQHLGHHQQHPPPPPPPSTVAAAAAVAVSAAQAVAAAAAAAQNYSGPPPPPPGMVCVRKTQFARDAVFGQYFSGPEIERSISKKENLSVVFRERGGRAPNFRYLSGREMTTSPQRRRRRLQIFTAAGADGYHRSISRHHTRLPPSQKKILREIGNIFPARGFFPEMRRRRTFFSPRFFFPFFFRETGIDLSLFFLPIIIVIFFLPLR